MQPGFHGLLDFTGIPAGVPLAGNPAGVPLAGRRVLNAEAARQLAERERALQAKRRQAEMAKRAMIESEAASRSSVAAFALILAEV